MKKTFFRMNRRLLYSLTILICILVTLASALPVHADGGGWPSSTPTDTRTPKPTKTFTPIPGSLENPLLGPTQAPGENPFMPGAETPMPTPENPFEALITPGGSILGEEATPTPAPRGALGTILSCWPFILILVVVIILGLLLAPRFLKTGQRTDTSGI